MTIGETPYPANLSEAREHIRFLEAQLAEERARGASMLAILERVSKGQPNFFTSELTYDPSEEDMGQLVADLRTLLLKHGRTPGW